MIRACSIGSLLAMAALAGGQAQRSGTQPGERYASVTGVVLDQATGAPLAGAVVTLGRSSTDIDSRADAVAWTDGRGAFAFLQVPPGQYSLYASDKGYALSGPPAGFSLVSGEERRIALRMHPVSSISGTVTDPEGDPVPRANVMLLRAGNRREPPHGYTGQASTDERGRYSIHDQEPGRYLLVAFAYEQAPLRSEAVRGQPAEEPARALQFYLDADRLSSAATVTLAPGRSLGGFDFHMSPQPGSRIEGRVFVPPETPPDVRIRVQVNNEDMLGYGPSENATVSPDGAFEVKGLPWGRYVLHTDLTIDGRPYRGVQHVETGRNPVSVTIRLDPLAEISGLVRTYGDAGALPQRFRIRLVPREPLLAWLQVAPQAEVGPDGAFRFENVLPGAWGVATNWWTIDGWFVQSMHFGNLDLPAGDMTIGAGSNPPLSIVLTRRGAVVEGTVESARGASRLVARILLAPVERFDSGDVLKVPPYTTTSDETGHFQIGEVAPGAYRIYAIDRLDTDPSEYSDLVGSLGDRGDPLQVVAGGHVSKQLRVISTARLEEAK